jgi:hypothetical protein
MLRGLILLLPMMLVSQFVFADSDARTPTPTPTSVNSTYKKGALCYNAGSAIFRCVGLGDITIPDIYAKGYRVVATIPNSQGTYIVIEEQ